MSAYKAVGRLTIGVEPPVPVAAFLAGWAGVAAAVLARQARQVRRSSRRAEDGDSEPSRASFWSWASNGHVLAVAPPLLMLFLYAAVR